MADSNVGLFRYSVRTAVAVIISAAAVIVISFSNGRPCGSFAVSGGQDALGGPWPHILQLTPGAVATNYGGIDVCTARPDFLISSGVALKEVASLIFIAGILFLMFNYLDSVYGGDKFCRARSRTLLLILGWYLIIGSSIAATIETYGNSIVVSQIAKGVDFSWQPSFFFGYMAAGLVLLYYRARSVRKLSRELFKISWFCQTC